MTYALTLVKGRPEKREETLSFLESLIGNPEFEKNSGVTMERVFISFGWPDFVLLLRSENVELIKFGIVYMRDVVAKTGDNLETSTIICATEDEIREKRRVWAAKFSP